MFAGLVKRIQFHRKTFRLLWVPVIIVWTIFSNAATIRDNFFSPYWQQKFATLNLLPKWHWYVWVIGTLIIVILALIEGSYRAAQSEAPEASLPIHRPTVTPHGYGKHMDKAGLHITNPGYAAYDVHIPTVAIGSTGYTLNFPETIPQLLERDHLRIMAAELDHPTLPGRTGGDLFDVMRIGGVDEIEFSIVYKDAELRWYKSDCVIQRNVTVRGGLTVQYRGQELIESPLVAKNKLIKDVWESVGKDGPRLLLHWNYPQEVAYGGAANPKKILLVENASTAEDAFDVQLQEINISATRQISATIEPIPRIARGQHARANVLLRGSVPEGKQGDFQMVYFAAGGVRPEFEEYTSRGELKLVRIPLVLTFRDYAGKRYWARFEFVDNMLSDEQQITFIRSETLAAARRDPLLEGAMQWLALPAPQRKPRLSFSVFQFVRARYDLEAGAWHEEWGEYCAQTLVFHFTNDVYDDGKGESATIKAQVSWQYRNGSPGPSFSPAAWMDERCGIVEIPVGWSKKLIIGVRSGMKGGQYWDGYSNPRKNAADNHSLDGQTVPYDGIMSIKLIGSTDEVWWSGKFDWKEDLEHGSHPTFRQIFE